MSTQLCVSGEIAGIDSISVQSKRSASQAEKSDDKIKQGSNTDNEKESKLVLCPVLIEMGCPEQ